MLGRQRQRHREIDREIDRDRETQRERDRDRQRQEGGWGPTARSRQWKQTLHYITPTTHTGRADLMSVVWKVSKVPWEERPKKGGEIRQKKRGRERERNREEGEEGKAWARDAELTRGCVFTTWGDQGLLTSF